MTDLEITRRCAEAMGYDEYSEHLGAQGRIWIYLERDAGIGTRNYDPLHDDAQAMALVKKFGLFISCGSKQWWQVSEDDISYTYGNESLNRAICECVAKIQKARA